jgi:hypothetical protein
MNRIFRMAEAKADLIEEASGKEVIAIRTFNNCLCVYFLKGGCKFFSKDKLDWGKNDKVYFITKKFSIKKMSSRLIEQFNPLINWTSEYIESGYPEKLWLQLEYNIKYA